MSGIEPVAGDGRIFVNFPRWTEDSEVSVAEWKDGQVRPYPDEGWNAWRNAKKDEVTPHDHWVCVRSVAAGQRGSLWVLDPAAPAQAHPVAGGEVRTVVQDKRLRWPDTFGQGPDGTIHVTTSHIQDSAFFKPEAPAALPTQLWKVVL